MEDVKCYKQTHPSLFKTGELLWPHVQPFIENRTNPYLLQPIQTKRSMAVEHLPTYVPFTMFSNTNSEKKKMFAMLGLVPLVLV
jgi:hypothetical protein